MDQLFVESNKGYKHGFVLKEQDLRRLVDLINEQFKKINNDEPKYTYNIKFKNGAIAATSDIEAVLKQDNEGSGSIMRLEIEGVLTSGQSVIKVDFKDVGYFDDDNISALRYSVKGPSRDWVFITSSMLDERVIKIKRNNILRLINTRNSFFLFPIFMLVMMFTTFTSMPNRINSGKIVAIDRVEEQWKAHKITDPVDAMIRLQRGIVDADSQKNGTGMLLEVFLIPFVLIVGILLFFYLLNLLFTKFYPLYTFYWGGNIENFDRKESVRKIIVGVLIGTIILGVVVNLLSNFIWEKI